MGGSGYIRKWGGGVCVDILGGRVGNVTVWIYREIG